MLFSDGAVIDVGQKCDRGDFSPLRRSARSVELCRYMFRAGSRAPDLDDLSPTAEKSWPPLERRRDEDEDQEVS